MLVFENALSFKLSLNYSCILLIFFFFLTRLSPFYFTKFEAESIVGPRVISQKDALVALFVFRLISNRSKFECVRLKNPRWSDSPWVFRSYRSIQIPSFSQNARDAQATEQVAHKIRFQRFLVRPYPPFRFLSKFWLGDDPRRRDVAGFQVTSTTNPWTRSSAGCYVSSLKNINAKDMLIKSTSITSCCRENQSWKYEALYYLNVFFWLITPR